MFLFPRPPNFWVRGWSFLFHPSLLTSNITIVIHTFYLENAGQYSRRLWGYTTYRGLGMDGLLTIPLCFVEHIGFEGESGHGACIISQIASMECSFQLIKWGTIHKKSNETYQIWMKLRGNLKKKNAQFSSCWKA